MSHRRLLLSCLVAAALVPEASLAAPVLDQEFAPVDNTTVANTRFSLKAQTLTVGLTGTLQRVELLARTSGVSGDHLLEIYSASPGGPPDLAQLRGSGIIPSFEAAAQSTWVNIDVDVGVSAGELLALVFRNQGTGELFVRGRWENPPADPYPGGILWTFTEPFGQEEGWYPGTNPTIVQEAAFRTFVEVVPEPSPAVLLLAGVLAATVARRAG